MKKFFSSTIVKIIIGIIILFVFVGFVYKYKYNYYVDSCNERHAENPKELKHCLEQIDNVMDSM